METAAFKPELGGRLAEALQKAANLSSEALRLERLAKRVYAACYIAAEGTVAEREARARTALKFTEAEDAYISAQHAANVAEAEAEGLRVRFETFRSLNATRRAEMQIR